MSLQLLLETQPLTYVPCVSGQNTVYAPHLCELPREFNEEIRDFLGFWYDAAADEYGLAVSLSIAVWPGWDNKIYYINAETGALKRTEQGNGFQFHNRIIYNGSQKKLYGTSLFFGTGVQEYDRETLQLMGPVIVTPADMGLTSFFKPFLLNRLSTRIVVSNTLRIDVWDYSIPALVGVISTPVFTSQATMIYESEELGWSLHLGEDGLPTLIKFNYETLLVEGMTALQAGTDPDLQVLGAYDSLRKTMAIMRRRPPAVNGAPTDVLGLYKPAAVATNITEPVPVEALLTGKSTTFSAHMYGERGEVGTISPVGVSALVGTIPQSQVTPTANGAITFQYQAASSVGLDTVTLTADL